MKKLKTLRPRLARFRLPIGWKVFSRHYLERYQADLWIWGTITLLLALILGLLLARIFFTGSHLSGQALETGQRVLIRVANGETIGNPRHTRQAEHNVEHAIVPTVESPTQPSTVKTPIPTPVIEPRTPTPSVQDQALPPAPLASLAEQTSRGLLPMIGKDGTLPWKYYARPHATSPGKPLVALVLTGLGLSKPRTEDALALPADFTLSFSPYAGDARKWAQVARSKGFETLVDLPMQSVDFTKNGLDPGPHGLMEEAGAEENSDRANWVMSRFSGYVGLLAPADESLTGNPAVIRPALIELTGHGVLFLYVKSARNAPLTALIAQGQLQGLGIDTVIDDDTSRRAISKQLETLAALAKTQGRAIGVAHAYPPTLEALAHWREELSAQGIELVPVSALALSAGSPSSAKGHP